MIKRSNLLIKELSVYVSQIMIFFCVTFLISNQLTDQKSLEAYISTKANDFFIKEFLFTFLSTIFIVGLLTVLNRTISNSIISDVIDEVVDSIPRTIYIFGSSYTGIILAITLFVTYRPELKTMTPVAWLSLDILLGVIFFTYGYILKFALCRKAKNSEHEETI